MMSVTQTPHGPPSPRTDHVTSSQTQQSAGQDSPVNPPSSLAVQITEDQLGPSETEAELTAMHGSPAHSHYSGTQHSPTQPRPSSVLAELSSVEVEHRPTTSHTSTQDMTAQTQPSSIPSSPTNLNITQSDLSAQCSLVIFAPSSPIPSSPERRPTEEPTLDQRSPPETSIPPLPAPPSPTLCEAEQDFSTLDRGSLLLTYCSPTLTLRTQVVRTPRSAPCSPSQSPVRPTQCSWSQPASPAQLSGTPLSTNEKSSAELNTEAPGSTKTSPSHENQTLESNLANLAPTLDLPSASSPFCFPMPSPVSLEDSSVLPIPALPTSENLHQGITSEGLDNQASSTESREIVNILTPASPATERSHVSPSHVSSHASPSHPSEMSAAHSPASVGLAQDSPTATTVHMSPTHQASASPLSKSPSPSTATQDEQIEMPVATRCHSDSIQDSLIHGSSPQTSPVHSKSTCAASPIHNEANVGTTHLTCAGGSPSHHPTTSSPTLVSTAESTSVGSLTHVQANCGSSHANQVEVSPIATSASFSPMSTDANLVHSPANDISPVSISSTCQTQVSPVNTSCASVTHSPAGSSPSAHASPLHDLSSPSHSSLLHAHSPQQADSTHSSLPNASPAHSPAHTNEICASPTNSAVETSKPCASPKPSPPHASDPYTSTTRNDETCASPAHSPTHTSDPRESPLTSPLHTSEPCSSPMHTVASTSPLQVDPKSVKSTDCFSHRSSTPASPLHDDASTVSLRPISPSQTQETSVTEAQDLIASAPYEISLRLLHATLALSTLVHHRLLRSMLALSTLVPRCQPPATLAQSMLALFRLARLVLAQSMLHPLRPTPSMLALSMKVPLSLAPSMQVLSMLVPPSLAPFTLALSMLVSRLLVLSTLVLSMKVLLGLAPSMLALAMLAALSLVPLSLLPLALPMLVPPMLAPRSLAPYALALAWLSPHTRALCILFRLQLAQRYLVLLTAPLQCLALVPTETQKTTELPLWTDPLAIKKAPSRIKSLIHNTQAQRLAPNIQPTHRQVLKPQFGLMLALVLQDHFLANSAHS
ncbi:hypothetical protein N1851_004103 [Merluccius polli]|uniref:Uncharacterized protein n=1 Tax=Merluccius polli TaxID=89951 RepID=A0AA47N8L2_MERPO|nr:hypothetical protein N1851_004103 [Merluccius polli]